MTLLQALVLGIIQGATEFLPISSTAHLTFAGKALHMIDPLQPAQWTATIAVIQLGTLVAVLAYFRAEIVAIVSALVEESIVSWRPIRKQSPTAKLGWLIALGTAPVVVFGLAFKKAIEGTFTKNLWVMAASMIVFAVILWLAEWAARKERGIGDATWMDAVIIGCAQACALVPGASRSGTTISAGLLVGLDRESAARFSFLLSIPAVFASGMLELKQALPSLAGAPLFALIVSTAVSGVVGYASIWFLLRYMRTHKTNVFVYYRLALGAAIVVALVTHVVQP